MLKHNGEIYIFELKTMKEGGGGQDKQTAEIIQFISFSESNKKVHYVVFIDGLFLNRLFKENSPKAKEQRKNIEDALVNNKGNYFLNTKGLETFINQLTNKN